MDVSEVRSTQARILRDILKSGEPGRSISRRW